MNEIALSLVAHTNVGKTTLARTLLRQDIGEVGDRAHVTLLAERHAWIATDAERLVLWDTPGFGDSVRLARRLARANGGSARVTLSVAVSAHARMFPSPTGQLVVSPPDVEASDGVISYVPYSDGFDFGERPRTAADRARRRRVSAASLSAIVRRLAAAGRPVTCVVSALLLPAADVALEHGIPLAVFWNQSAATLAAYYHYFHGHEHLVAAAAAHVGGADDPAALSYELVTLPGLPPLRVRDLPSFLVDATGGEHARAVGTGQRRACPATTRHRQVVTVAS